MSTAVVTLHVLQIDMRLQRNKGLFTHSTDGRRGGGGAPTEAEHIAEGAAADGAKHALDRAVGRVRVYRRRPACAHTD